MKLFLPFVILSILVVGVVVSYSYTTYIPNKISIVSGRFDPQYLAVSPGSTVTWVNEDSVIHDVMADDESFSSGDLTNGERFTYEFAEVGEHFYHCDIHPSMVGTVIVAE